MIVEQTDLVSAVITTHNRLEFLKKAIKSVKEQTYKNIEIIVVDDGSTDGTKEFCINEKGIKYIEILKEDHKNGNYARNLGIKNSNGKFIAFLDDDDEWYSTKIEKQVKKIKRNNNIGMVYTNRKIIVNDGQYIYITSINNENKNDCKKKCLYNIFSVTSAMMFRKEALENVGLFDENVNFWQETELVIRICQNYMIDFIDEPLLLYRQYVNGKKQLSNNIEGFKQAVQYINEKHKDLIEYLSTDEKRIRRQMILKDLSNRYTSQKKYIESRKCLYKIFKIDPSIKNFIKVIINFNNVTKLKIKILLARW